MLYWSDYNQVGSHSKAYFTSIQNHNIRMLDNLPAKSYRQFKKVTWSAKRMVFISHELHIGEKLFCTLFARENTLFWGTRIFFYKNKLYKNIEAEKPRKFKNILRISWGSDLLQKTSKNILFTFDEAIPRLRNHNNAKAIYCSDPRSLSEVMSDFFHKSCHFTFRVPNNQLIEFKFFTFIRI